MDPAAAHETRPVRPRPDVKGREARSRFFQMSLDLFAIWDADLVMQDVNERWHDTLGWPTSRLRGRRLVDLVHPQDVHDLKMACATMRDHESATFEVRFRDAAGGHRWLDWTGMYDAKHSVYHGVARDRTEHHALDVLSRAIVEDVEDYAIFMLDLDGRVRTWNRGARRCKGYTADQIIGRHIRTFYPPDQQDRPQQLLDKAAKVGRAEDEGWRMRRDGSRFWANVVITAVHDLDGAVVGFTKLTRDLTERRQNEEAQRQAFQQATELKQMERLSRMRANLLNLVAHELRTPLTPLRMQVQMLQSSRIGDLNEPQRRAVSVLERNVVRISRLIDDILDVSRLEANRLQLEPTQVDVSTLLGDVHAAFLPAAQAKGIGFAVTGGGFHARFDPDRILQVLYNLVDNAIKFTPEGGSVTLRASRDGDVLLEVIDTGRGLQPDEKDRLFEPFVQIQPQIDGSGLGLYISRGIVEQHGGTIGCRSEGHGTGSTFWVRLPAGT